MNSGATAQGWQTPGSTMTYPGANTIGVANSGNTAWRTPLFSDITGLFGSGSCSGLLKSDGTCVLASTLNVASALTASNVQCYLQDTCPNDAIWQAPWLTTSQPYLAAGYPLGATDTTMTIMRKQHLQYNPRKARNYSLCNFSQRGQHGRGSE
jgi:hypothetical protein